MDKEKEYSKLMSLDFNGIGTADAVERVGKLIDLSIYLMKCRGWRVYKGVSI